MENFKKILYTFLNQEATTKALADLESLDKGILQRLFPDISVSEKLVCVTHFNYNLCLVFEGLASFFFFHEHIGFLKSY